MADNIKAFPSPLDMTTPEQALREAIERGLDDVLILGTTPEGLLFMRSSGDVTRQDALWMIEVAKMRVMTEDDGE